MREIAISLFHAYTDRKGVQHPATKSPFATRATSPWEGLVTSLTTPPEPVATPPKDLPDAAKQIKAIKESTSSVWSPAVFLEDRRANDRVEKISTLVGDYDGMTDGEANRILAAVAPYRHVWATSFSHRHWTKDEKACFRVVVCLTRPILPEEFDLVRMAFDLLIVRGGDPELRGSDENAADPARIYFAGTVPAETAQHAASGVSHQGSCPLDVDGLIEHVKNDPSARVSVGMQLKALKTRAAIKHAVSAEDPREGPAPGWRLYRAKQLCERADPADKGHGGRAATFALAHALVRGLELSDEQALDALRHWNDRRGANPQGAWEDEDLERFISEAGTTESPATWGYLATKDHARKHDPDASDLTRLYRSIVIDTTVEGVFAAVREADGFVHTFLNDPRVVGPLAEWHEHMGSIDVVFFEAEPRIKPWFNGLASLVSAEVKARKARRVDGKISTAKATGTLLAVNSDGDVDLAQIVIESRNLSVRDLGASWAYNPDTGVYEADSEAEIDRAIIALNGRVKLDGKPIKMQFSQVKGIRNIIHARLASEGFFSKAPPGVAFADGFAVVDKDGVRLVAHSPEHRAATAIPGAFPTSPPAPVEWFGLLRMLFQGDDDAQQKVDLIQEFIGAALLGIAPQYQRALLCVGEGSDGKSSLLGAIEDLFPDNQRTAITPQQWGDEKRLAALALSRLNVVADVHGNAIPDSASVKPMISGDRMAARHLYQEVFYFVPRAAQAFGVNTMLSSKDTTDGFFRRWAVIRFNNRFERNAGSLTGPRERVRQADRTVAQIQEAIRPERAAIVRWALDGAARLIARGAYTLPASHEVEVKEWRADNDPFQEWAVASIGPPVDGMATAFRTLLDSFTAYHAGNDEVKLAKRTFARRLRALSGTKPQHRRDGEYYAIALKGRAHVH